MLAFDGHNDTLLRLYEAGGDERAFVEGDAELAIDRPRARSAELAAGMFAIFVPSPGEDEAWKKGSYAPPVGHATAAETTRAVIALAERIAAAGGAEVTLVRDVAALDAAHARGGLGIVVHLEGAEAVDPDLTDLDEWYAAGVRSLGPVWSRQNAFAHGVPFRFPSSPDHGPGLTAAGIRLVERCNELGIVVDLSHLNTAGFWGVAEHSRAPLVASHSNAHALCEASRNLTDDQIDAIAASDGVIGINFAVVFTRADGTEDADTPLTDFVRHMAYVAERVGIRHVGLGSDFDGAPMPNDLREVGGLPALFEALRGAGFGEPEISQVAWENWRRVLGATWRS